jgi:threonine/homoserine/homoserine lactone efflux protein
LKDPIFGVSFASIGDDDMPTSARMIFAVFFRMIFAVLLMLAAAFCVFQAFAAGELSDPRVYWVIDGIIGMATLGGACWLLWPVRSNV